MHETTGRRLKKYWPDRVRRIPLATGKGCGRKGLPFEPLNPNIETIATMKAARRGDLIKVGKSQDLLGSINTGD